MARKGRNMVGPAFTLRYIPAREDLNQLEVFRNPDHPQRAAVEACPPGAVHGDGQPQGPARRRGGGILVTRLMVRGVAGVVTDGGFRDSPEIAPAGDPRLPQPPVLADQPDAAPGARHQRADRLRRRGGLARRRRGRRRRVGHRRPAALADEIADEAVEMTAFEDFVTEEVQGGRSIIGLYPPPTRRRSRTSPPGARQRALIPGLGVRPGGSSLIPLPSMGSS